MAMDKFHEKMLSVMNPNFKIPSPLPDTTPIQISADESAMNINESSIPVERTSVIQKSPELQISNSERANIRKIMSQMFDNSNIGNKNIQHRKRKEIGYW